MQLVGKFVKAISVHLCLFDSIGQGVQPVLHFMNVVVCKNTFVIWTLWYKTVKHVDRATMARSAPHLANSAAILCQQAPSKSQRVLAGELSWPALQHSRGHFPGVFAFGRV